MSDPTPPSTTPVIQSAGDSVTNAPSKPKGLASTDLLTQVASAITDAAPSVIPSVVKTLAAREIDKRATALLAGIDLAIGAKRDLGKIDRPDIAPTLDRDGKNIGEGSFTKARLEEIKKGKEKLAKIEKAIEKATRPEGAEFGDLLGLTAKGGSGGGDKPASDTPATEGS